MCTYRVHTCAHVHGDCYVVGLHIYVHLRCVGVSAQLHTQDHRCRLFKQAVLQLGLVFLPEWAGLRKRVHACMVVVGVCRSQFTPAQHTKMMH